MSQSKKYIIEVATNKASLEKLRSDLEKATQLPKDGIEVPALSREAKAQVKKDLATMFGVAEHQAEALQKMMQAAADGFADGKSVEEMKNQLKETLEFTNSIMQKMQKMGAATSWMDRGVTFVDDFIKMKDSIGIIDGIEKSVGRLEKTFEKFKDALAETNADAFLQRFGTSTKNDAQEFAAAQKTLQKLAKTRYKAVSEAIASGKSEELDYTGYNKEELEAEYADSIRIIKEGNQKIAQLKKEYKGKTQQLYKDKNYLDAISDMSMAMHQLENMHGLGDGIGSDLRASMQIATDSVREAGNEIQNLVKKLQGQGIELAVTLPDASSAEFASQINKFVEKASEEFKKKPIEIEFNIASPFKNDAFDKNGELKKLTAKQQELSDKAAASFKNAAQSAGLEVDDADLTGLYHKNVNKMARNVLDAFTQMHGAMTSGQKLLKTSAEAWRRDMSEAFTVKPKFNTEETKQNIKNAISDLQNEFDVSDEDTSNFWIVAKPDTRNFIKDVQDAIQGQSVTVDVKAGSIDGSGAVVNLGGATMISGGSSPIVVGAQQKQQESSAPRPISNLPNEQIPATNTNSAVVAENTSAQNVLTEAIRRLDFNIGVNNKRIELINSSEDNKTPDEVIASLDTRLAEMNKKRSELVAQKEDIKLQREAETDSSKRDALIKKERDIEEILAKQWSQYVELEARRRNIEYKKNNPEADNNDNNQDAIRSRYEKENKQLEKYKKALTSIVENDENPTKLIVDELKQFWKSTNKEIQKATENNDVVAQNRWQSKAASMITKGLDITKLSSDGTMELIDNDEAIKIVESVLKRNKALASTLLQDDALKTSAYVKRMGYYIPEVQKTMGVIPQSTIEADNELNLNESFKAALKLNEYIKRARDLLKIKDVDVDPSSIQKFIDYFNYFPEMASSVEYAQKYLTEMQAISDEPWKSKDQKTYQTQVAEIWDTLDNQYKQQFLDALNGTEAAAGKNISWISDFRDDASYKIARDAYFNTKDVYGLEHLLSTDNPQLQQILDILRRSSLLNQVKTSSKMFDDGNGVLSSLYGVQRDSGTMHATVVGRNGQEKVLELNGGKTTTESDKRYTYAPNSFKRFINNSGVKTEIDDLVTAMFDPTLLLRDRLDAEVRQLEAEIANLKIGHFSPNAFDGTPLEASWKEQRSKLVSARSLRDYLTDGTVDDSLYYSHKNIRKEKNTESLIRKMKTQGYVPDYLQEQIKDLNDSEKDVAVQKEIKSLEQKLINLKASNKVLATTKLSEVQSELNTLIRDNQSAILDLIKTRSQELESKREELKAAEIAAAPAERNVADKSEALFNSGKFRLSANATAAKPLWAQEEGFSKTPLGRYQEKVKANKPQQERLLAEIKDIENGIYSDAITKRLGGLSEDAQSLEIQKIIAEKKALYDRLNVTLPTQEEIFQSLLVRDKDIEIAKAKAQREASRSNKRESLAERVASGDDKSAYNNVVREQRKAIEKRDYHLEGLLSRINFADETGLMDTSELKALADDYKKKLAATLELPTRGAHMTTRETASNEAQREINALVDEAYKAWEDYENAKKQFEELNDKLTSGKITEQDFKSSGVAENLNAAKEIYEAARNKVYAIGSDANAIEPGTIEDFSSAYEELFQARKALLDKFFGTKGWNVTKALQDKFSAIDGDLLEEERRIRSEAGGKNGAIEGEISRIRTEEASTKATADRYVDSLIQQYITDPQDEVERALRSKIEEVQNIKNNTKAQKDALRKRVQDDTYLSGQINTIETERSQDFALNRIIEKRSKVAGIDKALALIDGPLKEINDRYYADQNIAPILDLIEQLKSKKRNLKEAGNQNTDDYKKVVEEYDKVYDQLVQLRAPYIQEINSAIESAFVDAPIEQREYLDYIKKEFGYRIKGKNTDLERRVLTEQKSSLLSSLDGSDSIEAEINAGYDARISAVKQLQESDKVIHAQIEEINQRWKKEAAPIEQAMLKLRQQPGGVQTDGYKELISRREQINIKYNTEIREAQNEWFKEQEALLDQQEADLLSGLAEGFGVDTKGQLKAFNKMASEKLGKKVAVRSQGGIERIIQEIKAKAYAEAEAATTQALAQVDKSTEVSPEDIEKQIVAARAEAEAKKKNAIAELSKKSDVEIMAMRHETASQNLDKSAEASRAHARKLEEEQKADLERYGITQQMVETANLNATAANELTEARSREGGVVQQTSMFTSGTSSENQSFGGFAVSNLVGAFNTSDLAKESTLRGIYQLLNGGPPKGGWGDSIGDSNRAHDDNTKNVNLSEIDTFIKNANFAKSLKNLMDNAKSLSKEHGTLIGSGQVLSTFTSNEKRSIQGTDIIDAIKNTQRKIDFLLHNHPNGTHYPSMGDINASRILSDHYIPVKGTGVYSDSGVTLMDFSNIPNDIVQDVITDSISQWVKDIEKDGLTYDETHKQLATLDDRYIGSTQEELKELSLSAFKKLYSGIASNFAKAGYNDVLKTFTYDEIAQMAEPNVDANVAQQAVAKVADAVVEAGVQTAVDSTKQITKDDIKSKQTTLQEKFKTKNAETGKIEYSVKGASKIDQALYNVGDRLTKEALTDGDLTKLTKAYSQLENAFKEEIINQLDKETIDFLNTLRGQISSVLESNSSRLSVKDQQSKAITEAKDYLSKLKAEDGKRVSGTSRASTGIDQVYSVLNKGKEELSDKDLKSIAEGYYRLQQTVNHAVFEKLDENTKKVINDAIQEAKSVLDKYNVTVKSDELVGTVLDDSNKDLFKNANKKDKKKKIGRTISAVAEPQIMKGDKVLSSASVYLDGTSKKQAEERAVAEATITQEKKKQNQLASESAQVENKATEQTKERAKTEKKITESKKKTQAVDTPKVDSGAGNVPPSTPSNDVRVPDGGGNDGGILGLLSRIAQESTLQSILGKLSSGVKTTSDKKGGSGKQSDKKKSDKSQNVSADDAWATAQDYIKKNYPNFTSLGSLRSVSGGYSLDVFQPKNLEAFATAQKRVNDLIAEGKMDTDEFKQAQAELNGLKLEQEKITLRIGNLNDEVQVTQEKSSFQNLALGIKAASKELQTVEGVLTQLHEVGALSIGNDGSPVSSVQGVAKYLDNLKALQDYQSKLSPDQLFDPAVQQNLSNLTLALQNSRKEVMALIKASSQLNIGEKIDTDKLKDGINGLSDGDIKKVMQDIITSNTDLETSFRELTPVTNEFGEVVGYQLAYSVRTGKHEMQEMTAMLNPLTNELRVQKGAVKEVATGWQQFFNGLKGKAASIMQYLISITSIHDVFRYVGQGVQYVRDIDLALTELKKVTDATDASYAKFLQNMSKTGSVIGATVSDLTTSAADWARLGYSMQEAGELAKNTSILMNVSEFEDVGQATETLISSLQAFRKEGQDVGTFSMEIIDKYNEVGNNYAISTSDLAESLTRSSAALVAANNSLEESIAMTAAANTIIQDPESVGKHILPTLKTAITVKSQRWLRPCKDFTI